MFIFKQFQEWKFLLSGVGLFPQPREIETMTTFLNRVAATIITFENPTKENVFVDVLLTSKLFFLYVTYVILKLLINIFYHNILSNILS